MTPGPGGERTTATTVSVSTSVWVQPAGALLPETEGLRVETKTPRMGRPRMKAGPAGLVVSSRVAGSEDALGERVIEIGAEGVGVAKE